MSNTPIFDAVLANSDPDIFLASNIFPNPTVVMETLIEALVRIGHPRFPSFATTPLRPAFTDWSYINQYQRVYPANETNSLFRGTWAGSVA